MKHLLLVSLGGFIGSAARFKLGGLVLHQSASWRFPLSTFLVNISGCFLIGLLAGLAEKHGYFSPEVRLFLFTGLLGGYTTFSTFGYENLFLLRRGEFFICILYSLLSVLVGILAVWIGFKLAGQGSQSV
jgi:fluoride exporter